MQQQRKGDARAVRTPPAWGGRRSSYAPSAHSGAPGSDGARPLLQQLRRACVACLCEVPPLAERAAAIAHNALQLAKRTGAAPELDELALALACALQGRLQPSRHHAVQAFHQPIAQGSTELELARKLELLIALARLHAVEGDADSTERCARRARKLATQMYGEMSLEAADVCTALLPSCADLAQTAQLAVDLAAAALLPRLRMLGLQHRATAAAHRNLGLALLAAGEPSDAAREYEEALQIERIMHGDDHASVVEGLELLALARSHGQARAAQMPTVEA